MWRKPKKMFSTVLVGGLFFCMGVTNVNAEESNELNLVEETVTPANIPLSVDLTPQSVNRSNVTSHTVTPRISWYDGVSNSFSVGYTNAYGQRQLSQRFTSYNVTLGSTTYIIPSTQTRFEGRHSATVSSLAGTKSMGGLIILNRR